MKKRLLNNWEAKLGSFIMAVILWVILKEAIEPGTIDQIRTGTLPRTESTNH